MLVLGAALVFRRPTRRIAQASSRPRAVPPPTVARFRILRRKHANAQPKLVQSFVRGAEARRAWEALRPSGPEHFEFWDGEQQRGHLFSAEA